MELNNLPKLTEKKLRRVGRGHGSGRGKTSGRGTKGQKAKRDISLFFEGGALPLIKRLPFLRGRGKNKSLKAKPLSLNLDRLNSLSPKTVVDIDILVKQGLVSKGAVKKGVKILGEGEIKVALNIKLPVSKIAKQKIEKAGGTVSVLPAGGQD